LANHIKSTFIDLCGIMWSPGMAQLKGERPGIDEIDTQSSLE